MIVCSSSLISGSMITGKRIVRIQANIKVEPNFSGPSLDTDLRYIIAHSCHHGNEAVMVLPPVHESN